MIWQFVEISQPFISTLISVRLLSVVIAATIIYLVMKVVFPPMNFPKNIPTIPFYVSFLGSYTNMDQEQIYNLYLREKLEKYGAVKVYFASRWNILVTRPHFLEQVFRYEDVFAKSGNQVKIPYAVLSDYTGDNVISAHGEVWRKYRSVVTAGIQFPDYSKVPENTNKFVTAIKSQVAANGCEISINDLIQKWSLANIGASMLGLDFKTLDADQLGIHKRLKVVKFHIFKPFYLNFPFFDKLPISSRIKARQVVREFRAYVSTLVKQAQISSCNFKSAGYRLFEALEAKVLSERQFTDNAMIIMVAGHENPQLFLTSLLYILAKYPGVQDTLRNETLSKNGEIEVNSPYLNSVVYEALRMFPPLGQIINRCTTQDVILGQDIRIPKGTYVGYNNFGTGRDRTVWGTDANEFKPERWGTSLEEVAKNYAMAKTQCRLTAFHGRKRACLGEKFALYETKYALVAILQEFKVQLDPTWHEKLTPAGPISPLMLKLKFELIN